MHIYMSFINFV